MTRDELKALWVTGYVPTQSDYVDFFDSFVNVDDCRKSYDITEDMLDREYQYTINHKKGTKDFTVTLRDSDGIIQAPYGIVKAVDENNILFSPGAPWNGKILIDFWI